MGKSKIDSLAPAAEGAKPPESEGAAVSGLTCATAGAPSVPEETVEGYQVVHEVPESRQPQVGI